MKIGDLVRFRSSGNQYGDWLGLIIRAIPGTGEIKVVEWTHKNKGRDRGLYEAKDLVRVSENR